MKLLSLSGGSTKGIAHVAVWEHLMSQNWRPDVTVGVSIGAILQLPLILRKEEMIKDVFFSLKLKDFWSIAPVTEKGGFNLRALWNVILGKRYLGATGRLRDLIKQFVTEDDFEDFLDSGIESYVVFIDIYTGKLHTVLVNDLEYDEYVSYTLASASIPVFTPGVLQRVGPYEDLYYDGGIRVHNPGHLLLKDRKFDEVISVFLRPEDMTSVLGRSVPKKILPVLMRTIDIMNYEISKRDALLEKIYMPTVTQVFTPKVLTSLYDTDNSRIKLLYDKTKQMLCA